MPLLNSYQAEGGGVLVVLVFGIAVEKHYVSREGRGMYESFGLLVLLWTLITFLVHLIERWYQKQS